MTTQSPSAAALAMPPLIKRNIVLFTLSQSFNGAGMQLAYGMGPLMVLALTSSAALAGLSVAVIGLSRFLVAYPVGKVMDAYGRKPAILLGLVLALFGALALSLSIETRSLLLLTTGMLIFAMGMNAAQQLRVAATDMVLPHRRGQALGYVALGSLAGLVFFPPMMRFSEAYAASFGLHELGLPWLLIPLLILPGMVLVKLVRPDPKEIGMNLSRYYPGYVAPPHEHDAAGPAAFSWSDAVRPLPIRLAIACNCAAQGNMAVIMVLTSLVLHKHGHSLSAIAFSHMFHSAGMFAFTIPLGWLSDRIGRARVMYPGVAVTMVGAALVVFPQAYWFVTLGTFLVGLGWAAANVAATAYIADHSETSRRGRTIGINDTAAGAIAVLMAVLTGPLIGLGGLAAAGIMAMTVSLLPALLIPAVLSDRRAAHVRQPAGALEED
ncbi:MAG TPA: MFS transporter [Alphaproteobacteria bacterium]|nr:MFS transporter [Alphaproteobacteria bacterium]